MDGQTIDFCITTIGRKLNLPTNGQLPEGMSGLIKKQHENMLEGEFP